MLDVDCMQDVFREVKLRKFKNEYCSVCHQEDSCHKKSEIKICMQLDGYELALRCTMTLTAQEKSLSKL